jgi:tRNA-binding EMAP/Myf-like protein
MLRKRYAGVQVQGAQNAAEASAASSSSSSSSSSSADAKKELIYSNAVEFPLDLAVGQIAEVSAVPDSDKLLVLQVDMGAAQPRRQIVSALKVNNIVICSWF